MKKYILFAASAAVLAGCANDEIIDESAKGGKEVPITLSANRQNITRANNTLESNQHYNFGASAYKYTTGSKNATVIMENYLVGYAGDKIGYAHDIAKQTTWASTVGSQTDHTSPWVYEGLGTNEYLTASNGTGENYYLKTDTRYMSQHANQYLRYWDLAYANTNFYCYAPYMASGVNLTVNADGSAEMTFNTTTSMTDGYDEPLNSAYIDSKVDRSLSEFIFGGAKATNSDLKDVKIEFKHMGAQLFIRFYEDVPGYKVEMINLTQDSKDANPIDRFQGIQATPAKLDGTSYSLDKYFITAGGKVSFAADATATYTPVLGGANRSDKNLMFKIPGAVTTYPTGIMPTNFAANLTDYVGANSVTHKIIQEAVTSGSQANWSWSPTIYYPVSQNTVANGHTAGLTFHVSYRIIAEDNKEVITVHNATVHVPCANTAWQAGNRYIYTFKITRNATGTTDPEADIKPSDPTPSTKKSLYPIVFDGCTVVDYTDAESGHLISGDTTTY